MQTQSHDKRSAELASRLGARLGVPEAKVLEVCSDFDNAVEFAALEGKSIAEGIDEFLADGDGPFFDELARMIAARADSIDFAGIRLLVLTDGAFELRTIGRAGFARMSDLLRKREQSWLQAGFPAAYAETLAYGMDEAECGAKVLRAWGLAEEIIEEVGFQRTPESSGSPLEWWLFVAGLADEHTTGVTKGAIFDRIRSRQAANCGAADLFNGGKAA